MATVGSIVAVWVCAVLSIGEISAQCGNTADEIVAVANRLKVCADPIEVLNRDEINNIRRQLNRICSNMECTLSCMDTVIGNCDATNDFYVTLDKQTMRASYRGLCADATAATNAFTGCEDALVTALAGCIPRYKSATDQMDRYFQSGNGALYKQTACSAMASLKACFNLSPTGSCTTTYADFVTTHFKTVFTYGTTCGHPTTTQWFQDYSGPVNITGLTCGVSAVASSTPFLAAMACLVALIKYMHT